MENELDRLRAENATLRAALEKASKCWEASFEDPRTCLEITPDDLCSGCTARAALDATGHLDDGKLSRPDANVSRSGKNEPEESEVSQSVNPECGACGLLLSTCENMRANNRTRRVCCQACSHAYP